MFAKKKSIFRRMVIFSVVFTLLLSFWTSSMAYAVAIVPNTTAELVLSRELSRSKVLLDEEITITYKIQPKQIEESALKRPDKEIYLVIDTSGSMNYNLAGNSIPEGRNEKKRLEIAQEAAFNFLDKLSGDNRVKVGLITYDNTGVVKQSLTKTLSSVKDKIRKLKANGGTNIGDGMRLGYYRLNDNKSTSEKPIDKYLILLTDGEPTYHSTYNYSPYNFYFEDGNAPRYKGGGSRSEPNDITYCYSIAERFLKPSDIKSYMIAFTKGSNANVLNEIAQKAGGVYKRAETSAALDNVYNEIYEDIIAEFSVENIKFEEKFPEGLTVVSVPEGFTVNGQTVRGSLSNINYKYNSVKKVYEADPVEFTIRLKGTNKGRYLLNTSKLSYRDIDNNDKTVNFSNKTVEVIALQADIEIDRSLDKEETVVKREFVVNEEFYVYYTVKPKAFSIDPDLNAPTQLLVKDVFFSEEFPEGLTIVSASNGLTVSGRKVSGNLGNIIYTYDSRDGKYKADPISFNIKLCGDEGEYTLGKDNTSRIKYSDLDKKTKTVNFAELNPVIVKFGKPALEVTKVDRRGEVVDITLKVTLPKRTEYGEIRLPVIREDGTIAKENGGVVVRINGREETYSTEFEYKNLSIYKTHRVWLWAVSDFDENTTGETDIVTIFEAININ